MNQDGYYFFKKRKRISDEIVHDIIMWILGIFISIFMAFITVYFFGLSIVSSDESMSPIINESQKVLIDRFVYKISQPSRGDVVAFLPNGNTNTSYYIKRVVAVPGDKIYVSDGVLFVNDEPSDICQAKVADPGLLSEEFVIESGTFFVIGDDPSVSEDSRSANIGPVESKFILGKVWFAFSDGSSKMHFID